LNAFGKSCAASQLSPQFRDNDRARFAQDDPLQKASLLRGSHGIDRLRQIFVRADR
jgi:hypothetical protein